MGAGPPGRGMAPPAHAQGPSYVPSSRRLAALGALFAGLAVAAAAYGTHSLRHSMDEVHFQIFEAAARYHLLHGIAMVAIGISPIAAHVRVATWLFVIGTTLFCGSLYICGLSGPIWSCLITPIGGLTLIAAWLVLALRLFRGA